MKRARSGRPARGASAPAMCALFALCALAACGGGGTATSAELATAPAVAVAATPPAASTPAASPPTTTAPPAETPRSWQRTATLSGLCCSYTPFVWLNGQPVVFSNALSASTDGEWYRFSADAQQRWSGQRVLSLADVADVPAATFKVRTSAVRHHASLGWVAVLRVGAGYPSMDGYVPAWATSVDGWNWRYHGKLRIEGRVWPASSDAANLVLQADKPATRDDTQPLNNRFLAFENNLSGDAQGKRLVLLYSADGVDWRIHRNAAGAVVDWWPPDAALAADTPLFVTAENVRGDIHLLAGDAWRESSTPVRAHRHLCVPAGGTQLRYLGDAATWRAGIKGSNLAYDEATDTLQALSTGWLYSWPRAATGCAQP